MSLYSAPPSTSSTSTISTSNSLEDYKKAESKASEVVTPPQVASSDGAIQEKAEYRDQDGNLLDEEQIKALEGKVSFSTRYETKTRILDALGNEVADEASSIAPPHPDVERVPGTKGSLPDSDARVSPASASPEGDLRRERSLDDIDAGRPRPASEAKEATKQ